MAVKQKKRLYVSQTFEVVSSNTIAILKVLVLEIDPSDLFYPRLVECHPHVDPRKVWVGTFDAMGDGSSQDPLARVQLDHQRAATVALQTQFV